MVVKWISEPAKRKDRVALTQLIYWQKAAPTRSGQLKEHVWRRVREDLCESTDRAHGVTVEYQGAAASAEPAAAATGPIAMDLDS
jgi:hypothetical protein